MSDKGSENYKKFLIGDLRIHTIYQAWNSKKMKDLRKLQLEGRLRENPTCANCVKFTFPTKKFVREQSELFDKKEMFI